VHWVSGKDLPDSTVDRIAPKKFIGPACVIDVTKDVERNADFLLTSGHIRQWEAGHGRIPSGAWVLLRTGWSKTRRSRAIHQPQGRRAAHPGWAKECSEFLAASRDVLGVGVETVGTDAGQAAKFDPPFSNHYFMHGSGKFGLASLCNLDQLPPTGPWSSAAPQNRQRLRQPLRVLAITP